MPPRSPTALRTRRAARALARAERRAHPTSGRAALALVLLGGMAFVPAVRAATPAVQDGTRDDRAPRAQDMRAQDRSGPDRPRLTIAQGRVFRVLGHYDSLPDAERALEVAERAWTFARAAHGLDDTPPEEPLRVHLYRDPAAFDEACRACDEGTWPGHGGLTSQRWGIALVRVGDGLGPVRQAHHGLLEEDLWRVAHEAAHLVGLEARRRAGDARPAPPGWWEEGVAEWVATRTLAAPGPAGEHPATSQRWAFAQELLDRELLPPLATVLADEWPLDPFRRYALLGALLEHLARDAGGAPPAPDAPLDPDRVELDLRRHLARLAPRWALGPGYLQADGEGALLQVARDDGPALAWRLPRLDTGHLVLGGGLAFPPGPAAGDAEGRDASADPAASPGADPGRGPGAPPRARIAFARAYVGHPGGWNERYLALELAPGRAPRLVRVHGTERQDGVQVLAQGVRPLRAAPPGSPWRLALHVDDGELRLTVDDEEVLHVAHAALEDLDGQWGLGTTAGGAVRWIDLGLR